MKSLTRIASLVLALFLFMGNAAPAAFAAQIPQKQSIGFVTATHLRLRSSASTSSATLDYASNEEIVVILGKVGQWYKVSYNLQIGYMHSSYLRVTVRENAELGYGEITGNKVNVRSGPSASYASLAKANAGDRAYIIGINNQWFKVIYGNHIGYIRSDFVELTEIPYENQDSQKKPLFFVGGKSSGLTPSADALKENTSQPPVDTAPVPPVEELPESLADQIIATAKQHIGVPYLWGGTTPKGFDCSGYVQYVLAQHGISMPRVSYQQWEVGTPVSRQDLQPGDLVFFANTYTAGVSHLGIYVGDGQFIHSSSSKGVIISSLSNSYWASHYHGAKRVL